LCTPRADQRSRPQPPGDNRWQRGATIDALYLAHEEDTLWAEWYRHLAERGIPPMHQLPRDQWGYRVPRLDVADLTTAERLARLDLDPPTPGRRAWPPYQTVGETLWSEGWPGLIAPSAASAGVVLCLFVEDPASLPAEPVPPPRVITEPPALPTGIRM
jgi:RES domain-containing protein